ncbi:MAG: tetratricopeptide repeat protein [Candidatus Micrarchaeota archaeon]|nr:tetratricopeptide repeat protein [Candidatus Micrarchaeota archaeon]
MTDERQDYYVVKIEQALSKKDLENAFEYLKIVNSIGNSFSNPLIKYQQAKILYYQRNFSEAEKIVRELVKSENTNPLFHELYGLVLMAQGNFQEAKKELEIFDDFFDSAKSKFLLGVINLLEGNQKEAFTYFKIAYEYDKVMFSKLLLNLEVELFSNTEVLPKISILLSKLLE